MWHAGQEDAIQSFTILTTEPNELTRFARTMKLDRQLGVLLLDRTTLSSIADEMP